MPRREPDYDDSTLRCPDCEKPNQFGELCAACCADAQDIILATDAEIRAAVRGPSNA